MRERSLHGHIAFRYSTKRQTRSSTILNAFHWGLPAGSWGRTRSGQAIVKVPEGCQTGRPYVTEMDAYYRLVTKTVRYPLYFFPERRKKYLLARCWYPYSNLGGPGNDN